MTTRLWETRQTQNQGTRDHAIGYVIQRPVQVHLHRSLPLGYFLRRSYISAGRISFTARRKPPRTESIVSEVIGVEVHIIRRGAA